MILLCFPSHGFPIIFLSIPLFSFLLLTIPIIMHKSYSMCNGHWLVPVIIFLCSINILNSFTDETMVANLSSSIIIALDYYEASFPFFPWTHVCSKSWLWEYHFHHILPLKTISLIFQNLVNTDTFLVQGLIVKSPPPRLPRKRAKDGQGILLLSPEEGQTDTDRPQVIYGNK